MSSLARRIIEESNEDLSTTELYGTVMDNIYTIIDGLEILSKEFKDAHSDTEVSDYNNLGKTYDAVQNICNALDKSGFTYFSQPTDFKKNILSKIFNNFIEFYESYVDGFNEDEIEILNTNSKDLLSILEKLK
jgi:hypothetical protein